MDDAQFAELTAWISNAGLSGQDETTMLTEFCTRIAAHGLPLTRAQAFIDTLHPIYGGRAYTWQIAKGETTATEYAPANDGEMLARWQQSPFYRLIQSGSSVLRLRLTKDVHAEYPLLGELYALGITEYVAIVDRFGADAVIGEMDCVYSSWSTNAPQGFTEAEVPTLARIAKTLVETYLGRDPGRRVLKGGIARGISSSIEAVLWFSDLHDYTRICDRARPDEIIALLNDYAETVISAIHDEGGDVLKLIGDGTLALFTAQDRASALHSALAAAGKTLDRIAELKQRRLASGLPATDLYLGLHLGEVVYGNFGSRERLDFYVGGSAGDEGRRI